MATGEHRHGVALSSLDEPLFADAGVPKRALIDYLEAMHDRIVPVLRDRPLSVIRTTGDEPFMQKNLPKYTPEWVARVSIWAEASHREVSYGLCNDLPTLLWFGNQRAVEYHPTLGRIPDIFLPTHLVVDLDPPAGADFAVVVAAARLIERALDDVGLSGAVKTSGAKGIHIYVPVVDGTAAEDAAAATRAIARRAETLDPNLATTAFLKDDRDGKVFLDATRSGGATVVAAYSPRARPGVPVSFPLTWDRLDDVRPSDFTITNVARLLHGADPWTDQMPDPQVLPADLLAEGHEIPIPRVAAMHEGKRRKRAAD
jgi:bifunctional non-homologous end joining protein LigD